MGAGADELISAQVLVPEQGGAPEEARRWFAAAGLEADPVVGRSFAMSGSRAAFEQVFGAREMRRWPRRRAGPRRPAGLGAAAVEAVAFRGPPDFGPRDY